MNPTDIHNPIVRFLAGEDIDIDALNVGADDVHLSFSRSGQVFERSSQAEDYKLRAKELNHLSVWDFLSTVDKVTKSATGNDKGFNEELDDVGEEDGPPIRDHNADTGPYELQAERYEYWKKVQHIRTQH